MLLLAVEASAVPILQRLASLSFLRTPGVSLAGWESWIQQTPPADAVASILRLVATAAAAWLLATTLLYLVARLGHLRRVVRALEWTTLPTIRRLVDRAAALSLVATLAGGSAAMASGGPPPPVPLPIASPIPLPSPSIQGAGPAAADRHAVVAGESLWLISAEHLKASGDAVAPYWRRVVKANRSTLRSGNPNLIFPGETISLPPT